MVGTRAWRILSAGAVTAIVGLPWWAGASALDALSVDQPPISGGKDQLGAKDAAVVVSFESEYHLVGDVPHAHRDAEAFRRFLLDTRGVPEHKLKFIDQPVTTERDLQTALSDFSAMVEPGGTLWIYFAGHGIRSTDGTDRLLLMPSVNPRLGEFEKSALSVNRIPESLKLPEGARAIAVLDACSNMTRVAPTFASARSVVDLESLMPESTSSFYVWSATDKDQMSWPIEGQQHGAFTYFLIGAMSGWADGSLPSGSVGERDGTVTDQEVKSFLRQIFTSLALPEVQRPFLQVSPPAAPIALTRGTALWPRPEWSALMSVTGASSPKAPVTPAAAPPPPTTPTEGTDRSGGSRLASALTPPVLIATGVVTPSTEPKPPAAPKSPAAPKPSVAPQSSVAVREQPARDGGLQLGVDVGDVSMLRVEWSFPTGPVAEVGLGIMGGVGASASGSPAGLVGPAVYVDVPLTDSRKWQLEVGGGGGVVGTYVGGWGFVAGQYDPPAPWHANLGVLVGTNGTAVFAPVANFGYVW